MRNWLGAVVIVAHVAVCAAPAHAADLLEEARQRETHTGAFAGARLRVSLGGVRESTRAGMVVAPSVHVIANGASRLRIGEGLEYGVSDRRPAGISLAGRRITDISGVQRQPEGQRRNVSTLGWVAIGAGVVVVAGAVFMGWLIHEANENTE